MSAPARLARSLGRIAPAAALALGALILWTQLLQGWFPHDEGALGQAAERVLNGEWPHRDFDDIYTGALSAWNALAFALFGISSATMRLPLFVVTIAWQWLTYAMLRRFVPSPWAAIGGLVALLWSVPNYPAPMPSWYVLFCATATAYAMVRWTEDGRLRWVFAAGLASGIACAFKVNGIVALAGAVLAVLVVASRRDAERVPTRPALPRTAVWLLLASAGAALMMVTGLRSAREFARFVAPIALLLGATAIALVPRTRSWRLGRIDLRAIGVLVLGGALPIVVLGLAYATVGGLEALIEGVLIVPFRRMTLASALPPSHTELIYALPLGALLWLRPRTPRWPLAAAGGTTILALLTVWLSGSSASWYAAGWFTAWAFVPLVALEAARQILVPSQPLAPQRNAALVVACVAVAFGLIEYPFAEPIYVLYAWPLAFVALVALVRSGERMPPSAQAVIVLAFLAFGVLRILPGTAMSLGRRFVRTQETATLALPRGRLRVGAGDSAVFAELIPLVQRHAEGGVLWAGPDAPEIYFLSGVPNRTRALFDFLGDSSTYATSLSERLAELGADVVVLKSPPFSAPVSAEEWTEIRRRYPQERTVGYYTVLWR